MKLPSVADCNQKNAYCAFFPPFFHVSFQITPPPHTGVGLHVAASQVFTMDVTPPPPGTWPVKRTDRKILRASAVAYILFFCHFRELACQLQGNPF